MGILNPGVSLEQFKHTIKEIKRVFSEHRSKLDDLERRIEILEDKDNPWKMPFD